MPPFHDSQIFIIAPGSQTTLAQHGLPESFTPAQYRFPSRMFAAEQKGEYEPIKIRRKEKTPAVETNGNAPAPTTAPTDDTSDPTANGEQKEAEPKPEVAKEEESEWEEDRLSEEGAIWPMQKGSIVDWPCFYALMEHVYNSVNPPFHTPILLISQPVWTHKEYEKVAQYFFEKFKVPALAIVDSALAVSYAYGVANATIIDVGLDKADISCVADFILQDIGRGLAVPDCGGEALTARLVELLSGKKGFTKDVCEQLKKSHICEILPADEPLPTTSDVVNGTVAGNPAAAASTGIDGAAAQKKAMVAGEVPRGPGPGTEVGEEKKLEDEEGVLDIASIVTGGNMNEYLAQKEKEKADKAAAKQSQKKGGDAQQNAANKPARLPNSKRARNTFVYEDLALRDAMKKAGVTSQGMNDMQSALNEGSAKKQSISEPQSGTADKPADPALLQPEKRVETGPNGGIRREIEVGTERFQAATGGILDRLADAIHRTIQSCGEINKRRELWDSLIILGNGSKIRGFKEALFATLQAKYLISPSSATIFTSELPSNFSTPMATGANTPQPQLPGQLHHGPGVNPLLHAALTAQNPQLQPATPNVGLPGSQSTHSSSHGQTPTSIKLAKIPEYFPEWKEVGYDEATFLGAQVAGKVLFIADNGPSKGYMTRTDYNDQGPSGIHDVRM